MRKFFLSLCLLVIATSMKAQSFEPEFIGECVVLTINGNDTIATPLQKTKGFVKTKAGASMYLTGMGAIKSRVTLEGTSSACKIQAGQRNVVIVKVTDNNIDPNSFISIMKFEVKGKERRCEIGKVSTFGGASEGNIASLDYQVKRYGTSSFALYITPELGEYGLKINNPQQKDEKILLLHCFSVE